LEGAFHPNISALYFDKVLQNVRKKNYCSKKQKVASLLVDVRTAACASNFSQRITLQLLLLLLLVLVVVVVVVVQFVVD